MTRAVRPRGRFSAAIHGRPGRVAGPFPRAFRRPLHAALLGVLLGALSPGPGAVAAEAPKAVAVASKTDVAVVESFAVEVRVSGPVGAVYEVPPDAVQEAFELHAEPPGSTPPPAGTYRYRAAVFALGDAQVPAIPIRYRLSEGDTGQIETAPIPLHVVSQLPKAKEEQKLADVRAPFTLGVGRAFWIGLVVAALLVAGLAAWIAMRRRASPLTAAPIQTIEPDLEALQALDALAASGRITRGEYRLFYIELTAIAKRYLEQRLGAPIVEMTTAEMLVHLRSRPESVALAPTLRDLSGAADQIKFARGSALIDEAQRHLAAARALVQELEARLRPPSPEPVSPSGGKAA
mgnify:CR=1 FL=1